MRTIGLVAALVLVSHAGLCSAAQFERAHELGLSLGTPSALNAEYSCELGNRALYVSGGYWGRLYGAQVGGSTLRKGTSETHGSLNVIGGYFAGKETDTSEWKNWTYGGAEIFFKWRRFFAAPGLCVGGGSFSNPQIVGRLGFTWKL